MVEPLLLPWVSSGAGAQGEPPGAAPAWAWCPAVPPGQGGVPGLCVCSSCSSWRCWRCWRCPGEPWQDWGAQGWRRDGDIPSVPAQERERAAQPRAGSSPRILPTHCWLLVPWSSEGQLQWQDTHTVSPDGRFTRQSWARSLWRGSGGPQGSRRPQPLRPGPLNPSPASGQCLGLVHLDQGLPRGSWSLLWLLAVLALLHRDTHTAGPAPAAGLALPQR